VKRLAQQAHLLSLPSNLLITHSLPPAVKAAPNKTVLPTTQRLPHLSTLDHKQRPLRNHTRNTHVPHTPHCAVADEKQPPPPVAPLTPPIEAPRGL
jgi:hypothetical protein